MSCHARLIINLGFFWNYCLNQEKPDKMCPSNNTSMAMTRLYLQQNNLIKMNHSTYMMSWTKQFFSADKKNFKGLRLYPECTNPKLHQSRYVVFPNAQIPTGTCVHFSVVQQILKGVCRIVRVGGDSGFGIAVFGKSTWSGLWCSGSVHSGNRHGVTSNKGLKANR